MKNLRDMLLQSGISEVIGSSDLEIHSLHFDSRKVNPGTLFFAVKGTTFDGHQFIPQAIAAGAVAIVCEAPPDKLQEGITYVVAEDSGYAQGIMADIFYDHPSRKLQLTGVTGTNGKTTTVTLLSDLFRALGYKTGLISTIQNKINDTILPATHTTPDSITLNEILATMVSEGCTHCFMEVSSHAISQHRIAGLAFCGGIFTNITHDHLDYHKDFASYVKAKKNFFDNLPAGAFALTNKDDKNGLVMLQNTQAAKLTYSMVAMADFRCRIIENRFEGLHLSVDGTECWIKLIGLFNAYNILTVYATAVLLGQDKQQVLTLLSGFEPVNGRFNPIRSKNGITAIVDYAHTPDALKNVLETIQAIRTGNEKIITVVGAGGNRDTTKRPIMAKTVGNLSDWVILTSDNPRFEDPELILEEMKKGIEVQDARKILVIVNRKEAIKAACALASKGDILLVAGKGHETYQDVQGVKHPFDDKKILTEILGTEK